MSDLNIPDLNIKPPASDNPSPSEGLKKIVDRTSKTFIAPEDGLYSFQSGKEPRLVGKPSIDDMFSVFVYDVPVKGFDVNKAKADILKAIQDVKPKTPRNATYTFKNGIEADMPKAEREIAIDAYSQGISDFMQAIERLFKDE